MKIFSIFILISTASSIRSLNKSNQDQIISIAIRDAANELYTRHKIQFEILIYGNVSPHVHDILNGFRKG